MSYTYTYTTSTTTTTSSLTPGEAVAVFVVVAVIVLLAYAVGALLLSRIFKKFGQPAWKAWVPVYSNWVTLQLGEQAGWWAILAFIPVVDIVAAVFMYIAYYKIGLKLGKPGAFVLLAIFLPLVWFIWLAVDKSTAITDTDGNQPIVPPTTPPTIPPAPQPPVPPTTPTPPSAPIA